MATPLPVLISRPGGAAVGGDEAIEQAVSTAFELAGRDIALQILDLEKMKPALERLAGAPVVAVGGGDAAFALAAVTLANSITALAFLPIGPCSRLGELLACQFNIPLDLTAAAHVAVAGQRRRIDLGIAADRVFLNNASFGLYTRFAREQARGNGGRWRAMLRAAWHILRNMGAQFFSLRIDGVPTILATPLLFIGNAAQAKPPERLGSEDQADRQLAICAMAWKRPMEMIGITCGAVFGLTHAPRHVFECGRGKEVVIEGTGAIEGTLDGVATVMPLPLRLKTLPGALGIITPRESAPFARTLSRIH